MKQVLINGVFESHIDVADRGFQYGDGLFETIAYKNKKLQLWNEHLQRMQEGCERLSLKKVDASVWLTDIKKLKLSEDAVIKLSISRGVSGRGYAYNKDDNVTRVTASYALPDYSTQQQGIIATLCKTPVSINRVLAGIKHLNRLDNVLARNEWQHSSENKNNKIAEGFMFDNQHHVIEGTMSNVFCILGDELYTPLLDCCGVAGVMREQTITLAKELKMPVNIVEISKQNFLQMDAIFVTNSLIGIWPVVELGDIKFKANKLIICLQNALAKMQ